MADSRLAKLDQHIAALRKRLEAAERMRQAIDDAPDLFDVLGLDGTKSSAFSNGSTASSRGRPSKKSRPAVTGGPKAQGYFDRIAQYLESKGNKPESIVDIAKGTGIKKASVIQVCYRTHTALFDPIGVPGHKTKRLWKLAKNWKETLAVAKQAAT
jgi:hypothetical protein